MPNTPFLPSSSLDTAAPFGQSTNAGLEQLIRGDAEEVGYAVQVDQLQFIPLAC